ncbi:protein cramped [Euwallacea similis]|uniref:protein cramped n=1 Tax=Euwallacea similis TaxID=1736056 RepID=UPI00344EDDAA
MEADESKEDIPKVNTSSYIPEEYLLGSITTSTLLKEERGVQIRSSARVFKKMRLEQEQDKKHDEMVNQEPLTSLNSEIPGMILGNSEKPQENEVKNQPHRGGARLVKKASGPVTESKSKKEEPKGDVKKEVRKWSYSDKLMFFEAVNEFGKDFEAIQQYINSKLKKRGSSEEQLRTKEHVRQFFIRTFHEVSKHVKFSEGVKKVVQELYGVINYGELYRKLGVITDKTLMKLSELIYRGGTCVRIKGKNVRVRTPMCKALVKLNQLDQKYEEVKLPNRVTVELKPKDMTSFLKVQCLAQNPRLKTVLPIQKRLSSLIECLNRRWKTIEAVIYEKAVLPENPLISDCAPSKQEIEEKSVFLTRPLRLSPPPEVKIELPSINLSGYFSRQTICLTAYERRLGMDTYTEIKKLMPKKRKTLPKMCVEQKSELEVCDSTKMELLKLEEREAASVDEREQDSLLADAVHEAVNTILSLQNFERQLSESSEAEEPKISDIVKEEIVPKMTEENLEQIENIRRGWSEATSQNLTIGEIYLMYGCDAKLILEYSWDGIEEEKLDKPSRTSGNFLEMWNESYEQSWQIRQRSFSSSLSKLVSLAKLHHSQNNVKCHCGHVCSDKPLKTATVNGPKLRKNLTDNIVIKLEEGAQFSSDAAIKNQETDIFRPPLEVPQSATTSQTSSMQQQLSSIQKLKPKYCSKKGRRLRQKPLVVERKLPLMPNNVSGHQIVRMSIISQEPPATLKEDLNLQQVITDPEEENSVVSTVPPSPSRILKEGEADWINADVADYSLSSLLGHLEIPVKTPPTATSSSNMGSDLSREVDAQLRSLMTECSMDFAANFADLAASVVNDK